MAASARLAAIAIGFFSVVQADLTSASAVKPGDIIKDCEACPELIVVAAGSFVMGSDRRTTEGPPRAVIVERPFAIGRFEVTVRQWQACVAAGGCVDRSGESAGQHPDRPAGGLSWHDARLYVGWLSRTTGYRYRMPSEAQWEFAARAGSTGDFWWGPQLGVGNAQCRDCGSPFGADGSAPVGSFRPNPFGLYDVSGNVWEWVEDCWHRSFGHVPGDDSAWLVPGCRMRVLRGGGWDDGAYMMHVTTRLGLEAGNSARSNGLRVMREIEDTERQ